MPLAVKIPENITLLSHGAPYKRALNVLDRKQTAVQRQLRRSGLAGYEPATQATLMALVELSSEPATFLDVGAHIGLYSALIAEIYRDKARIIAFEPTPETAAIARDIREKNRLHYEILPCAVSATPGAMTLYLSDRAETSNSLNPRFRVSTGTLQVPVTTLDLFCHNTTCSPDVIKVDIETHEAQALLGGMEVIRRARPHIVCEILPSHDQESMTRVLGSLEEAGYSFYRLSDESPWSPIGHRDYYNALSSESRDWLLSPSPVGQEFYAAFERWMTAISECGPSTNLTIPGGTPFPQGWDALYIR